MHFEDELEIAMFKDAVQGRGKIDLDSTKDNISNYAQTEIAVSTALKGIIRTSENQMSISEKYSNDIFGDGEMNPARRQRMHREHIAQKAIEKAKTVIAARESSGYHNNNSVNYATNMMDRFSSSKK